MNLKSIFLIVFVLSALFVSTSVPGEFSPQAQIHLLRGLKAIEEAKSPRDYLLAEAEFEKVIEISPEWAEGYYNLGLVCEAMGKETKAVKNYREYLRRKSKTREEKELQERIEKLINARETKRKIGLSGLSLVSLKDGIYILNLVEGSKLNKAGFLAGDKIVEINKRPLVEMTLKEFYELIEKHHEQPMLGARVQAYARSAGIETPVAFTIIRGKSRQVIVIPMSVFKTSVYEIEEEELEEEVYKSTIPVAVVTWMNWCTFCEKMIPVIEKLGETYRERVKFLTINLEMNRKFSEMFAVKAAPVTLLFTNGQLVDSFSGFRGEEPYETWLMGIIRKK
ncbi:MAG: thioredoxin domain-containing protein [Deltaproteobacteria bacterium]|nr:thioredoxin domain-containing protein [Deltaproteobacteria bacterium]